MSAVRHLLDGEITYAKAKEKETNVLHHLTYQSKQVEFRTFLYRRRGLIEARVAHHLGLRSASVCHVGDMTKWMQGGFNLCVPVTIENSKRVLIRFPLPFRFDESVCPGNSDEKVRCEAGTYAWLQEKCPSVPIPHLYGFALSTGQCFTALEHLPFFTRWLQHFRRRILSWLGYSAPSHFIQHQTNVSSELGAYLLIEYIDETQGEMLSITWEDKRTDKRLRANLFRGLARAMLALAQVSLPKIGSFIIDDHGFLRLENRPLTLQIQDLENEHIPIDIPRDRTYYTVDSYINDLISCHDSRLRHQPNAVNCFRDCIIQMSALMVMRAVAPQFFDPKLNHGPFAACLTDLRGNNILVDEEWNIKCLIDLEWAASLPLEFMRTPYWLTSQYVDKIDADAHNVLHEEFMEIFEEEEKGLHKYEGSLRFSSVMRNSWKLGTFWYILALQSPTGLNTLFYDRIQPHFTRTHMEDGQFYIITSFYWTRDTKAFIKGKVEDKKTYDKHLWEAFREP